VVIKDAGVSIAFRGIGIILDNASDYVVAIAGINKALGKDTRSTISITNDIVTTSGSDCVITIPSLNSVVLVNTVNGTYSNDCVFTSTSIDNSASTESSVVVLNPITNTTTVAVPIRVSSPSPVLMNPKKLLMPTVLKSEIVLVPMMRSLPARVLAMPD
jgi:hypothetical protein